MQSLSAASLRSSSQASSPRTSASSTPPAHSAPSTRLSSISTRTPNRPSASAAANHYYNRCWNGMSGNSRPSSSTRSQFNENLTPERSPFFRLATPCAAAGSKLDPASSNANARPSAPYGSPKLNLLPWATSLDRTRSTSSVPRWFSVITLIRLAYSKQAASG